MHYEQGGRRKLESKGVTDMQKLKSLAFWPMLFLMVSFIGNSYAAEVQVDNSYQKQKDFLIKVEDFLDQNPFPDSFFIVDVKNASINTDNRGPYLDVSFEIKYNDETLRKLQQVFNEYKNVLEVEASKDTLEIGDRTIGDAALLLDQEYRVPRKMSGKIREQFVNSANRGLISRKTDRQLTIVIFFEVKDASGTMIQQASLALEGEIADATRRIGAYTSAIDMREGINVVLPFGTIGRSADWDYTSGGSIRIHTRGENFYMVGHKLRLDIVLSVKPEEIKNIEVLIANRKKAIADEQKILEAQKQKEGEDRKRAEKEAQEEARRNSPEYKRSVITEELCQQYESLSQAKQAIKRQNEIDLATGTTNLYEKRQLGASKLYIEKEIESLKKEYKELGGGEFSRKKQCE